MASLFLVLLPILTADLLNPILFAAVTFALGSRAPFSRAFAVIGSFFVSYVVAGVVLALGIEAIGDFIRNPRVIDYWIGLIIGVALLGIGIIMAIPSRKPAQREMGDSASLSLGGAFWLGFQVNMIGIPFAIPYFAAIDQVMKMDLTAVEATGILVLYTTAYVLPFLILVLIRLVFQGQSDSLFERINQVLEKVSAWMAPVLLIGLGLLLIADAVGYLIFSMPILPVDSIR